MKTAIDISCWRVAVKYAAQKGIYEAQVYEGIPYVLRTIKCSGCKMAVATLKKQSLADQILSNFSLDEYFDVIVGMDESEKYTKKKTIELTIEAVNVLHCVMIGDSEYDYQGALAAGVDFVGVFYGFGLNKEIEYPFMTVDSPKELLGLV